MNKGLAVAVMMLCLAACGGDDEDEGGGVPTIKVTPFLFEGPYTVKGTIELPADTASGRATQFEFARVNAGINGGAEIEPGPSTTDSKTIHFEINGLEDGEYLFRLGVDQSGDRKLGTGDYEGWYGGTLQAPILDRQNAVVLKLEGRNHEGINFGIGPKP